MEKMGQPEENSEENEQSSDNCSYYNQLLFRKFNYRDLNEGQVIYFQPKQ